MPRKKLTLNRCTREDLLWIINRILQRTSFNNQDYELLRALNDLEYKKEKRQIAEAEKYGNLADQKRREYIALLEAYAGKPIKDIPLDILEKADRLQKEADAAEKKFCKLMGLEG